MSEIENGRLGYYGTEYSKCKHMITLGFKGLEEFALRPNLHHIFLAMTSAQS